jgi:hypothetical protein
LKEKKLINEIKGLNVEIKIALTMLLGGTFVMPIQYLRRVFGLGVMLTNIIVWLHAMLLVIRRLLMGYRLFLFQFTKQIVNSFT